MDDDIKYNESGIEIYDVCGLCGSDILDGDLFFVCPTCERINDGCDVVYSSEDSGEDSVFCNDVCKRKHEEN